MAGESVLLAGPNGAGKSTIIEAVQTLDYARYEVVHGSNVLKQAMGVVSYEGLERFSDDEKTERFNEAMVGILEAARIDEAGRDVLVDAHFLYFNRGEVIPCYGEWMEKLGGIAVLQTDAAQAVARMDADSKRGIRERHMFDPTLRDDTERADAFTGYMTRTQIEAMRFCEEAGLNFSVVNNFGTPQEAALELRRTLDAYPEMSTERAARCLSTAPTVGRISVPTL